MTALHFTGPPGCDVDDLGFEQPWTSKESWIGRGEYEQFWSDYFPTLVRRRQRWEQVDPRTNPKLLQRFVYKGVPQQFRADIWIRNCPSRWSTKTHPVPFQIVDQIKLDLPRTFPDNIFMKIHATQKALGRCLFAVAEHVPDVGYCQGLNFIAGLLLLVINDENKAIDLTVHLVQQRSQYYAPGMEGLRRDLLVLHNLMRRHCPRVIVAIEKLEVGLDLLVSKWFLCWFVETLPMETVLRIWDCFLYDGDVWLFRVAVVLFKHAAADIYKCTSIDKILNIIQEIGGRQSSLYCHQLIQDSLKVGITQAEVDSLRKSVKMTDLK